MNIGSYDASAADKVDTPSEVNVLDHQQATQESTDDGREFDIGDVVDVMPRLWSGINKPGGAARIKAFAYDEDEEEFTYTVKYILGGVEKDVSGVYITSADLEGKKHRGTIGRCRWCRSFIRDCEHDQEVDPFFQPVLIPRLQNNQSASVDSTNHDSALETSMPHAPPKKRKRSNETTEQRQARKQQKEQELLRMQQDRRDELLAREAEQERLLQLSRVSTTFLQDDETTLDGTHADMYDSMDLEDDEDWVPSDSDLAAAPQRRVGRIVQDSSDEEEEVPRREDEHPAEQLEPVKMSNNRGTNILVGAVKAAPRVVHQVQSAAPTSSENPIAPVHAGNIASTLAPVAHAVTKNDSWLSVPIGSNAVSVPLNTAAARTVLHQPDRVNVADNDAAHSGKNSAAALPASVVPPSAPRSYAFMSANDIAQDLHQRILKSCVGSAASDFINNSRSALNDRTAATVNDTFNQLIASIRTLSEDAKIALYHVAFDWFEALYRENMFDAPLDAIETRLKGLRNGQKTELSRLQKDLDVVDDEMEATLQQLARAGFDVFEKLGKFKDKAVRRMRKKLDTHNGLVSSTRVSARKRLERLRLRLQETSELWGCVDSESSNSGSDSDGNVSTSRGGDYSTHVPSFPAAKMAKFTTGTSFSRSHSNHSQNLSRSSTNSSGRQGGPSAKRIRSGDEAVSAHNYEDNNFSVDYDDPSMTGAVPQHVRGKGNSVPRAVPSSSALSRTGSHSRTGTTSVNLKPVCSKRVHKEMDFIFGSTKDRRNCSLAKKKMSDGSVRRTASGRDLHSSGERTNVQDGTATDTFVPLYRRASAPSVLDLPRYIRYHGRVTVLEGPLMGTVVVPASIERSPSYTLGTASTSWPGTHTSMEDEVGGADIGNPLRNDRPNFPRAAPAPPSAPSRLPEGRFSVPVSSAPSGAIIEPEQVSVVASLDSLDESLVDVVLSSMANPFAVEPPLHVRRQFYQLPSLLAHSSLATQAADEVWAEQFANHLAAETSATGIVRGLSLAATSAVQVILQRLALYEEATASSSQLHPTHSPRISASGFNEKKVFAELVSLAAEKISRLNVLFACVGTRLFLTPVAGSVEATERVSNVKQLAQSFDSFTSVACSRAPNVQREESEEIAVGKRSSCPLKRSLPQNLSDFLRLSTIEDFKSNELAVFVALSLLRIKVKTLSNCALHTLETAKMRILIDTNDAMCVLDRIEEEVADWDVMNDCFSALLALQQELTSVLLANPRLTLAVLHFLSEIPPNEREISNFSSGDANHGSFERGIGGVARLTAALFYEILTSLRTLHVSINTARASSSASIHGTRVWMCYDASREQANGVIATYPKYVWRDVVLSIYAHIARSPHSRGGEKLTPEGMTFFDEKQLRRAIVNTAVHRQRQHNSNESRSDEDENVAYLSAKESLWAIMTIFTHLLRSVKLAELASAATPAATSNRASSRVEGAWSLLKGLAHASLESTMASVASVSTDDLTSTAHELGVDNPGSSTSRSDCLTPLLRRVGHFAALWTDSPTEATSLVLSLLQKASPRFGSLFPLYGTLPNAVEVRGSSKSAHASGPPALDQKSVLFLCFYSFFEDRNALRNFHTGELEVRRSFTNQLSFLVAMMFERFQLPSNVCISEQHRSINAALDSGNRHRELTQTSLQALDAVRNTFKALLYNIYTEACASHDAATINSSLAIIRSAASKLPRSHQKLRLLALLESREDSGSGDLQAGTLLLSLLAEMILFFGPEAVRQKLKLSPSPGTVAMPLQQQVMEMLSHKLLTAAQGALSAGTADGASSADKQSTGAPTGAVDGSLLSEVDRLLQRVPIHQQQQSNKTNDVTSSVAGSTAAASTLPAVPHLDASAVYLCLQWQAGLVTFQPFPPDPSQLCLHEERNLPNVLLEGDLKRIVESQRFQCATLEPVLHLLRHSLQLQQNSSKLVNVFGAKAFVETALGASLAAGAMILGNINALTASRCTISVDTQSGSSGDVVTTRYPVILLAMPFFTELLNVVHVCLASSESSTSKDGLPFSAAYVLSQFILYLDNWHRTSRQLLSAAHSAINMDPTAKSYLSASFNEEESKMCELLSAALRLRPVPVIPTYKSSNVAFKASPSGLVTSFLTLLNSLTNSINKTDISVLDPSALFRTAAGETCITETARKMRMHKGNTSPGCCLAICQALGTLVSLVTNVTRTVLSPPATTATAAATCPELHRSGLAAALVNEVNDCLEKIDQTATTAGANALFGNWLKVVFWLPILQAAVLETSECVLNPTCLPLVSAYFPALVCVWVGCAALGDATVASRRILQQIDFVTFHRLLVQLAPVLVQQLQAKISSIGVAKLSSADMQCLRLAEAFTQVTSFPMGTISTNTSVFVVKFLRLLSAGSASSVLAALVVCSPITNGNGDNGGHTYSFPAVHRASFEAVNVQISRELLKCLQVLKLEIFRCGENPKVDSVESQQKHALEASATKLKGLFGDIAYLYRVLVVCEVPSAEFHPSSMMIANNSNSNGNNSNPSAVAVRLTARLLRSLQPFPRMVTLDLAFSFLGDIVEQDAMATIGLMFKHAARGDHASPEQHSALKKDLHRKFWCNVPKYLLLASDTPYSTRQTAWRSVLAPMLLTPAYTATGLFLAKQLTTSKTATGSTARALAPLPMLTESAMGEEAYFTLLVSALALALPVPEKLAVLGPAVSRTGDQSLGTKFVELFAARVKLPIKQATLWALYAQLAEIVRNTSMGTFTDSTADKPDAVEASHRQDSQLTRFKQYLLLGGGSVAQTTPGGTGSGPSKLGANLTGQSNLLWEQISTKAKDLLRMKIAEDQQRLSLQKSASFQPASQAMFVLPWGAVRACLQLHTCALEDVLEGLIATQRLSHASLPVPVTLVPRMIVPNVASEREELLSLVVTSAVYAVRGAVSLCDVQNQVRATYPLISETGKQLLQSLLQYCTLAVESVNSSWKHLQLLMNVNGSRSVAESEHATADIAAETEIVRVWGTCVHQLRQVLKLDVLIQSDICAFVMHCWQLLRCLYQLANCNNTLIVESFLASTAPSQGTAGVSLPPAPQLIFVATQCACVLCSQSSSIGAGSVWDGTENVSCVQTLQLAVAQLHRDLLRTLRPSNPALTAPQCAHLHELLGSKLDGVAKDLEGANPIFYA